MAIGFERERGGNLGDGCVPLVQGMPVLPVVNRDADRDAAVWQYDFSRVAVGISLRPAWLSDKMMFVYFSKASFSICAAEKVAGPMIAKRWPGRSILSD
jgi:hypothetical protein